MKKKRASILITNYNKSIFLNKCLKSSVDQDFYNKEILIFDDKSNDNSISIIKKFKKIKLFHLLILVFYISLPPKVSHVLIFYLNIYQTY